jgi:hypothetical protein
VDAIKPDTEPGLEKWLEINAEYAVKWPNITAKKEPPPDAKEFEGVPGKFEKYFSPEPGEGDLAIPGFSRGNPPRRLMTQRSIPPSCLPSTR